MSTLTPSALRHTTTAITLLGCTALLLTSCGSADSDNTENNDDATQTTSDEQEVTADSEAPGEEVTTLTFATPPGTDNPDTLDELVSLGEILEEATGLEVVQEIPADYLGVVEAVRQGHVDVAMMSPFATALALHNGSVDSLVTWAASDEPASFCYSQSGSDIETIDDVAGHSVAFVDPGSTTGYFLPAALMVDHGLEDGVDFDSQFAGGHDSALLALANGSVDVACSSILDILAEAGAVDADDFQLIGETGPIPVGISIVVTPGMDPDLRQLLMDTVPDHITDNPDLASLGGTSEPILDPGLDPYADLLEVAQNVGVNLEDMR